MCSVQKLNEAYEYLRSTGKIHTKKDLAELMSANRVNVSKAFSGDKKYLTEKFLMRLNHTFGNIFNNEWLLGDSCTMINENFSVDLSDGLQVKRVGIWNKDSKDANEESSVSKIIDSSVMLVPLVNQYAHAGYMSGYADEEYVETLPKIPWIVDKEYKGRYISFEVKGDSMDDGLKHSYEQGDILLCREINPDYWKCKLHIHQWDAFVIVHKTEGIVVKQIIDHDVEKGIITVHSFNPIYEDYKIDLREVAQIFNVVKQQKNK
ncbi:S24/S26 family peptidase [Parabacteroides sp. AGMB00274]|uniref:S24/S26 family peptidase n=1 Tax=Parabacteroides faecalis TaxID=2924040 RepID=A0ABT0C0W8_9BACT|nr:S24/S26 family peptidase [Parabacteroides faecalis]MCJ2380668.1 S24/S26 family peptidase [Parabacteroides faecalis]